MKKLLLSIAFLFTVALTTTSAFAEKHIPTTTGAELHAHSSNAP